MKLPLAILIVATLAAAVVAYGTLPAWMQYPNGLQIIMLSRRLQWPLLTLSLVSCLALIALVISAQRRAWWMIGLLPVLALFVHRFLTDPAQWFAVVEDPRFVAADSAKFVSDEDYVVGLRFGDSTYAYPYATLFRVPVVIQAEHDKRMMLMWSAFANRALAVTIARDFRARDLEVVSTPANALLIYNGRLGQFINGVTGQTIKRQKPTGVVGSIAASTMPWKRWRELNPATKVLAPMGDQRLPGPTRPVPPFFPMAPAAATLAPDLRVVLVGTTQPAAIKEDEISREPLNLKADTMPVLVFRQEPGKPIRAFDRGFMPDLWPRFTLNSGRKHKGAMFVDSDTESGWDADGNWVEGRKDFKGRRKLAAAPLQEGVSWRVIKFWYPELSLTNGAEMTADAR